MTRRVGLSKRVFTSEITHVDPPGLREIVRRPSLAACRCGTRSERGDPS